MDWVWLSVSDWDMSALFVFLVQVGEYVFWCEAEGVRDRVIEFAVLFDGDLVPIETDCDCVSVFDPAKDTDTDLEWVFRFVFVFGGDCDSDFVRS